MDEGIRVFGYEVRVTAGLGHDAAPREHARRMVRWGMKDILEWCGDTPGPPPWSIAEAVVVPHRKWLYVSRSFGSRLAQILEHQTTTPRTPLGEGDSTFMADLFALIMEREVDNTPEVFWVTKEMRARWL